MYLGGNRRWVPLHEHSLRKEKNGTAKQQQQQQPNGDGLENSRCFKLYRAYSISVDSSWQVFLDLIFKRLYRSSGKGKENLFLAFTFSTNCEMRYFHEV